MPASIWDPDSVFSAAKNYQIVETIADLRQVGKAGDKVALVLGYYTPGDGGGGLYYYDEADLTTADNGGSVIVANDAARWKLIDISGKYSIRQFGAVGDGVTDDTAEIQACINAAHPLGKEVFCPKGIYLITGLTVQPIYGGTSQLPLTIRGQGFDANGGNGGTVFKVSGTSNGFTYDNQTGQNADAEHRLRDLVILGDGTNVAGGHGVYAYQVNNLKLEGVWIQDMRNCGVYFEKCYGSGLEDVVLLRNRIWNFWAKEAFNIGFLKNVRGYGGGRIYQAGPCGNFRLSGAGNENLGVVFDNVDGSYAGGSAYKLFKKSDATLTNIVVNAGVATVTTTVAHDLVNGYQVAVVGATTAGLNTIYPAAVTVTGIFTFTFATSAANGTYTDAGLVIGPAAYGYHLDNTRGLEAKLYLEDSIGPALYVGASVKSANFSGGYWQCGALGCTIINDSAQNIEYGDMYQNGANNLFLISVPAGPHGVNLKSSVSFNSNAQLTLPSLYMKDGMYYSNAAPGSGTWTVGTYIKQSAPAVGQPKGWYCTVAGTPGTWVSEGNL